MTCSSDSPAGVVGMGWVGPGGPGLGRAGGQLVGHMSELTCSAHGPAVVVQQAVQAGSLLL